MIHKTEKQYMDIAANIALKSNLRSKHGCIIVDKKGNIISKAFNSAVVFQTNIKYVKSNVMSFHAEENALKNVDKTKLNGSSLYVVRNIGDGCFSCSKPCQKCENIIHSCMQRFKLKYVFYSVSSNSSEICDVKINLTETRITELN